MNSKKSNKQNTVYFVQLAILTAISIIFAFTPLGYLKLTPAIGATLSHIPVIIAAIVLGKWAGIYMGSLFGLLSFISFTFIYPADPMAPAFTPFAENAIMGKNWLSLVIVFVPRILLGFITWLLYYLFTKTSKNKNRPLWATLSALLGTFIHSVLVLSLIYFVFGSVYSEGMKYVNFIIAWAGINCIVEMIIAALISAALVIPLQKVLSNTRV